MVKFYVHVCENIGMQLHNYNMCYKEILKIINMYIVINLCAKPGLEKKEKQKHSGIFSNSTYSKVAKLLKKMWNVQIQNFRKLET